MNPEAQAMDFTMHGPAATSKILSEHLTLSLLFSMSFFCNVKIELERGWREGRREEGRGENEERRQEGRQREGRREEGRQGRHAGFLPKGTEIMAG